jgi:hypothetical protein
MGLLVKFFALLALGLSHPQLFVGIREGIPYELVSFQLVTRIPLEQFEYGMLLSGHVARLL